MPSTQGFGLHAENQWKYVILSGMLLGTQGSTIEIMEKSGRKIFH